MKRNYHGQPKEEPSLPSCPTCGNNRDVTIQNSGSAAQGPWQCKNLNNHENKTLEIFSRPACPRCTIYGNVEKTMKGEEKEWVCTAEHCGFKFNIGDDPKRQSNHETIRDGLHHATEERKRRVAEVAVKPAILKRDEFTERMKRKGRERKEKQKAKIKKELRSELYQEAIVDEQPSKKSSGMWKLLWWLATTVVGAAICKWLLGW